MHELIVRGGTVVDGTGGAAFAADVAVDQGASRRSAASTATPAK